MVTQDKVFISFYILCGVISSTLSIIKIIKAKDKDEIRDSVL